MDAAGAAQLRPAAMVVDRRLAYIDIDIDFETAGIVGRLTFGRRGVIGGAGIK
jgi:hypothetical protein